MCIAPLLLQALVLLVVAVAAAAPVAVAEYLHGRSRGEEKNDNK